MIKKILTIFLINLMITAPCYAETLHVTATGDASDPTTEGGAWDMSDASNASNWGVGALKISAGDTVIFHDTFTAKGGFRVQGSGSNGNNIIFQGDDCIIDADETDAYCIRLDGYSYLEFNGFHLKDATGSLFNGYDGTGNVRNTLIIHDMTFESGDGYNFWIDIDHVDGSLTGLEIYDIISFNSADNGIQLASTSTTEADYVSPLLYRITSYDNHGEGIRADGSRDLEIYDYYSLHDGIDNSANIMLGGGYTTGPDIHHCLLIQDPNGTGAENFWCDTTNIFTGLKFHNNVCINATNAASLHFDGADDGFVYNNSIYNTKNAMAIGANGQCTGMTLKNNIADEVGIWLNVGSGNSSTYTFDYNTWDENRGFDDNGTIRTWAEWNTVGYDVNGRYEDPVYVDPTNYDLSLQAGSNCINDGVDLGDTYTNGLADTSIWPDGVVTLNQDDYGAGWEMGAYVYGDALPASTTIKNATLRNWTK